MEKVFTDNSSMLRLLKGLMLDDVIRPYLNDNKTDYYLTYPFLESKANDTSSSPQFYTILSSDTRNFKGSFIVRFVIIDRERNIINSLNDISLSIISPDNTVVIQLDSSKPCYHSIDYLIGVPRNVMAFVVRASAHLTENQVLSILKYPVSLHLGDAIIPLVCPVVEKVKLFVLGISDVEESALADGDKMRNNYINDQRVRWKNYCNKYIHKEFSSDRGGAYKTLRQQSLNDLIQKEKEDDEKTKEMYIKAAEYILSHLDPYYRPPKFVAYLDLENYLVANNYDLNVDKRHEMETFFQQIGFITRESACCYVILNTNINRVIDLIEGNKQTSISGTKQSNTSSQGCYIATCVYGSYDCPEVWTLRRYRDYVLQKTVAGRLFIKCYYTISPTLVKWLGNTKLFHSLNRSLIDRWVESLRKKGYSGDPYQD